MENHGPLYCRPEFRGQPLQSRTSDKYCPVCKFKIRGSNHEQGRHHTTAVAKLKAR